MKTFRFVVPHQGSIPIINVTKVKNVKTMTVNLNNG